MLKNLGFVTMLVALAACGETTAPVPPAPEPEEPEPPPAVVPACAVGMTLAPGEKCRLSGGAEFAVRSDGSACLGGSLCAGSSITVNNFSASRIQGSNNWRIDSL